MKFPIDTKQFAARLTDDDLTLLNELLPDLLPDRDLTDNSITGREIFMAMVETASMKLLKKNASKPEDLKTIEELRFQISELHSMNQQQGNNLIIAEDRVKEKDLEIWRLQSLANDLTRNFDEISNNHSQIKETAEKLQKYVPVANEMRIVLEPLVSKVLSLYAEKIRIRTKVEATPGSILSSLFVRYITKQETELPGFPFLVAKPEIAALAKGLQNEE